MSKNLVLGLVALVVGLVALAVASGFAIERGLFLAHAEQATGTVVELRQSRFNNSTRAGKYAVVEFTPSGRSAERCESWSSRPPRYFVGERVIVWYDPAAPSDARLDDFTELWLPSLIAGPLALLFMPLGGFVLFLEARRRSRERLRTSGLSVVGTVTRAETSSVEEWGQVVQVLTVSALDPRTGAALEFKSHRTPGKGDEWVGKPVTVSFDPRNPRRCWVDVPYPGGAR